MKYPKQITEFTIKKAELIDMVIDEYFQISGNEIAKTYHLFPLIKDKGIFKNILAFRSFLRKLDYYDKLDLIPSVQYEWVTNPMSETGRLKQRDWSFVRKKQN